MNEWEAIARRGALEAFLEGDEERALDLLAAARAMGEAKEKRLGLGGRTGPAAMTRSQWRILGVASKSRVCEIIQTLEPLSVRKRTNDASEMAADARRKP